MSNVFLIAVRQPLTEKAWRVESIILHPHIVAISAKKSALNKRLNKIRQDAASGSHLSHYRHQDDDECGW